MKPRFGTVFRGALRGKSIGRILFTEAVRRKAGNLGGTVLDLAGGAEPSYLSVLPKGITLTRTNRVLSANVVAVDFNKTLPFADESYDAALFFNAIYIAEDPPAVLREVVRILKPGGVLLLSSPLIANEMPEPHDYVRFTAEGLRRLCHDAGFTTCTVERIGERASAATVLLHPFFLFNTVRALVFPLALFFDRLIPAGVRREHPTPILYFVTAQK